MSRPSILALATAFMLGTASGVAAQSYGQQQQQPGQGQGERYGQQQRQQQQPGQGQGQRYGQQQRQQQQPGQGYGQQRRQQQQPDQSGDLGDDRIRNTLRAYGYSNIENLEKDGDRYTADAERDGREVTVVVDAMTGRVVEANN